MSKNKNDSGTQIFRVQPNLIIHEPLPEPLDVVDPAINDHLQRNFPRWVDFTRVQTPEGRVEYRLTHGPVELGTIKLRRAPEQRTWFDVEEPALDQGPPLTNQEREHFAALLTREGREVAMEKITAYLDRQRHIHLWQRRHRLAMVLRRLGQLRELDDVLLERPIERRDSGHFRYSWKERLNIVREYRKGRDAGEITDKNAWAKTTYRITGKTLLRYEREFPEDVWDT